jgi:hypothetical protein
MNSMRMGLAVGFFGELFSTGGLDPNIPIHHSVHPRDTRLIAIGILAGHYRVPPKELEIKIHPPPPVITPLSFVHLGHVIFPGIAGGP